MKRTHFDSDHEAYRETVREFYTREVVPNYERWEEERLIDRSVYLAAGKAGILGLGVPEEFGGSGVTDYRFRQIVQEETARTNTTSFGRPWHCRTTSPSRTSCTSEPRSRRPAGCRVWLPARSSAPSR